MSIITISRGTFSGGRDLAECLAQKLGYPCISREVIVEAAERYGASEAALSLALNHPPSIIDRLKSERNRYIAYIRAVLCQRALEGDFIYHGYAGQHLLAGVHHLIRDKQIKVILSPLRVIVLPDVLTKMKYGQDDQKPP